MVGDFHESIFLLYICVHLLVCVFVGHTVRLTLTQPTAS